MKILVKNKDNDFSFKEEYRTTSPQLLYDGSFKMINADNISIYDILNEMRNAGYDKFSIHGDYYNSYIRLTSINSAEYTLSVWNIPRELALDFVRYKNEFNIDVDYAMNDIARIIEHYNSFPDEDKLFISLVLKENKK